MPKTLSDLEKLASEKNSNAPFAGEASNSVYTGSIDIRISRNGDWHYCGTKINRLSIVRLLAKILKKEQGRYYLVSPVEKLQIQVDDAPFVAVEMNRTVEENPRLIFRTNVDDRVVADKDHNIFVKYEKNGNPLPYIQVRSGLNALLSRPVYYELVDLATLCEAPLQNKMIVASGECSFEIGAV